MTEKAFSQQLLQELVPYWEKLRKTRIFQTLTTQDSVDLDLLRLYLIESYHMVKHNAQHQALVVWRTDVRNREYMRKVLRHALEEVDHDQLAMNDLVRLGVARLDVERSIPLPETVACTAYLYHTVLRENPVGRLGFSLWAEGANLLGDEIIGGIKRKFAITNDKDLSFFVAHQTLDKKHFGQAQEAIDTFAQTPHDREAVRTVAKTSFRQFLVLLEALYERYLQVKGGAALLRLPEEPSLKDATPGWL